MKTSRVVSATGGAVLAMILGFNFGLHSQTIGTGQITGLQQVSPQSLPQSGTFYRVQRSNYPPLPFDPFPELPVYSLGNDRFLIDDSSVDYAQLEAAQQAQLTAQSSATVGLMSASGGGLGLSPLVYDYGSTNLWLEIVAWSNATAYLTIHPPSNVTNGMYGLLYCTNIDPPISWQWLTYSEPGQTNLIVPNATDAQGFYRLRTANYSFGTNFWFAFFFMESENGYNLSVCISSPAGADRDSDHSRTRNHQRFLGGRGNGNKYSH